jgi:Ca2+:H+ antiporter
VDDAEPIKRPSMVARLSPWLRDWTIVVPIVGAVLVVLAWGLQPGPVLIVLFAGLLAASVLAAVHHAEILAHRVGEPFGSLLLAVAVTIIEVGLIVTLMTSGGERTASLARDTVFAAVMITCNGILGISVLIAALRTHVATFNAEGAATALATIATLTTLSLVLPSFTTTVSGPVFAPAQLAFAAVASLVLYGVFVLVQTVRHRDQFVPESLAVEEDDNGDPPTTRPSVSLGILIVALIAVVGLAKLESPAIEDGVEAIGAPASAVGVLIALLVLLPETLAAIRNARRDRVQASLNLAFGSAIASIGLTVPVIAIASIWLEGPLELGLGPTQIVLFVVTMLVGSLTVLPGRATVQEGAVHLVLLGAFLVLALVP